MMMDSYETKTDAERGGKTTEELKYQCTSLTTSNPPDLDKLCQSVVNTENNAQLCRYTFPSGND